MRSVTFLALFLTVAGAHATDEPGLAYIKKAKSLGIRAAVTPDALNAVRGVSYFDVRGITNGSLRMENGAGVLLAAKNGPVMVDVPSVPDWLVSETEVRMIVKAERQEEYGEIKVSLVQAQPQAIVGAAEAVLSANTPKRTAKSPAPAKINARGHRGAVRNSWVLTPNEVTPIYAQFIRKQNSKLSSREADRIAASVINYSLRYGVDARLVMAILMVESGFDPGATSRSGAMGLGQLMPGTARWMGVRNAYDSVDNLYGCIKLLSHHLRDYRSKGHDEDNSLRLALAAYNAGAGAVRRHGGIPPYRETQRYVVKVLGLYYAFLGA